VIPLLPDQPRGFSPGGTFPAHLDFFQIAGATEEYSFRACCLRQASFKGDFRMELSKLKVAIFADGADIQ